MSSVNGSGNARRIWPFAAINANEKEALDDARPTVAFYAGAPPYEVVFEKQGFLKEARALQKAVAEEGFLAASRLVPDEMVRAGNPLKNGGAPTLPLPWSTFFLERTHRTDLAYPPIHQQLYTVDVGRGI